MASLALRQIFLLILAFSLLYTLFSALPETNHNSRDNDYNQDSPSLKDRFRGYLDDNLPNLRDTPDHESTPTPPQQQRKQSPPANNNVDFKVPSSSSSSSTSEVDKNTNQRKPKPNGDTNTNSNFFDLKFDIYAPNEGPSWVDDQEWESLQILTEEEMDIEIINSYFDTDGNLTDEDLLRVSLDGLESDGQDESDGDVDVDASEVEGVQVEPEQESDIENTWDTNPDQKTDSKASRARLGNKCPNLHQARSTANFFRSSSTTTPAPSLRQPVIVRTADYNQYYDCKPIPSTQENLIKLALCISKVDCSQGFVQIIHRGAYLAIDLMPFEVSGNLTHDLYIHKVAGPDDFYLTLEGPQKLALSARIDPTGTDVMDKNPYLAVEGNPSGDIIYRADFRLVLPGSYSLSAKWTFEHFRAVRENKGGLFPQWTHSLLTEENTDLGVICPECDLDTFLEKVYKDRQQVFDACDRIRPVRGSYWLEEYAQRTYSDKDLYNSGLGTHKAAVPTESVPDTQDSDDEEDEDEQPEAASAAVATPAKVKSWRFVPNGCTMTTTDKLANPSSFNPVVQSCNSISSPLKELTKNGSSGGTKPVRQILFTGDSHIRTTYVAILQHYQQATDVQDYRFAARQETLPGTDIRLEFKADPFLDNLLKMSDEDLDRYDTIFLNFGQWPAGGNNIGGQWTSEQVMKHWQRILVRLLAWKQYGDDMTANAEDDDTPRRGKRVIWAGVNAYPMRTDREVRTNADWRTNARLGYWDDLFETLFQRLALHQGPWFRRLNSWQLTFPMLDQVRGLVHFDETDAMDGLIAEALYKLDLCTPLTTDSE